MQNYLECKLCGSPSFPKCLGYPGYQEPDIFAIYHCEHCNTSFSHPSVEESPIYDLIYKLGHKVPGYNRYWKYMHAIKHVSNPLAYLSDQEEAYWAVTKALDAIVNNNKTKFKILEIGSGLGYLTYSLVKAQYNTVGLDISNIAVRNSIKHFGHHYICANLHDFAQHNPCSFDIVIMTEVIEHVDAPIAFIQSIFSLLKPHGYAIITTPNKSLFPDQAIWASDLPPVHCWWFSEKSLDYIAHRLNASLTFMDFNDYYKNHYTAINTNSHLENHLPKPILDSSGNLRFQQDLRKDSSKSYFRSIISIRRYCLTVLRKLLNRFNPDIIICKSMAPILCAIFKKDSE